VADQFRLSGEAARRFAITEQNPAADGHLCSRRGYWRYQSRNRGFQDALMEIRQDPQH